MPRFYKRHLLIEGRSRSYPYTSISKGRDRVIPRKGLDRKRHAKSVKRQFIREVKAFRNEANPDFVYLVFQSPPGFLLNLDALQARNDFRLKTYKKINPITESGIEDLEDFNGDFSDEQIDDQSYYEATVYLNKKAISSFLQKVNQYSDSDTAGGNPRHQKLIANIEEIRAATLQSFWQEPEQPFPSTDVDVWWEVWINRASEDSGKPTVAILGEGFDINAIQVGARWLIFPESYVVLMKATAQNLAKSLLYSDRLMELRHPRELADFYTGLPMKEQEQWIADLVERITHNPQEIAVCLLDTGVTRANPLLTSLIPKKNLDALEPHWTKADTGLNNGHGTPMAGLALLGDLAELLTSREKIEIFHQLESVKILSPGHAHDPDNYGAVTIEAISRGELINPEAKRLVCMAVTREGYEHKGRPSSWSSAIDQAVFGTHLDPNDKMLFFLSAGNIDHEERLQYPLINEDKTIHDPAQAFNAITVGAYTLKDQIDLKRFPGATPLAQRGEMAPCSTTSHTWESEWARKPDIVMEGGNQAIQRADLTHPESLLPLSTGRGGVRPWLHTFGDTSGAAALAARFGAKLYQQYPELWPETIRGLIIHSATWTRAMLNGRNVSQLTQSELKALIKSVGYGVPNLQKAIYSANNSLSLIAQRTIKPYKIEESITKTDKFQLFTLPWPKEELEGLFNAPVKLKVTLSYFIEPNPNNKSYQLSASYASHGLRFKMIDRNESLDAFKARVSKAMREEDYLAEGGEHWLLGENTRNKGSVHKDIWMGTAIDLAGKNKIAIYPVGGWWRYRKQLKRYEHSVRYSLIVTIETPDTDIDIYTPVANIIDISI